MTDAEVIADVDGVRDAIYNTDVLIWGRACFDALKRNCLWHKARGYEGSCDALPPLRYAQSRPSAER